MTTNRVLGLPKEVLRRFGYRVVDALCDHDEQVAARRATTPTGRGQMEALLHEPAPRKGQPPLDVLHRALTQIFENVTHVDHPRFFAYVPSPGNMLAALADTLPTGFNVFAGTWQGGAAAAQVELTTIDWMRQSCGMPAGSFGLCTSGGSAAYLIALAAAWRA